LLDPGEDFNVNGRLDPGNVATVDHGIVTTDATGFALFNVVYAKQFAGWAEVELEAHAVVVGSEGSSQVRFFLPGAASDFNTCTAAPPALCSPFGVATTCNCDERTNPTCSTAHVPAPPPQCLVLALPVTITTGNTTHLPQAGGTFVFLVSGGTQTSYN